MQIQILEETMKRYQVVFLLIGLAVIATSAMFPNPWVLALAPAAYFGLGGPLYAGFMPESNIRNSTEPHMMFMVGALIGIFWLFGVMPTLMLSGIILPF
ncbi:hypothetical protein A3K29_02440 [Candidatus Collierbacteria bacterium RIFOXYB2_FULL_46_14]|nr:MAG: hypothetical protein A3K29_02440 [Candidatus Collierbacteria bacterium RIFOXYB2_FULL_46_14]OGD76021.1 MAG: hypothetical protein A3K43_02440 [Candidatus Collierbacteria bacterium RIFOXYA2_FULL_46_20]OGD77357.1 MAG: hypothetical protein A3K39_02440 [Candidatus Collierbacteria bacterium RIFOXYC2_FULL_43_15]OGD80647.1 MAG: hypothetical protein A2320_02935 [Pseudomonadales bacterium GWC2_63_15]OGD82079.1 MAG: hypothetical protein A3K36_02440 [Candidatus Collierbacteria bacterium RIFOXYD2_FUL